MHIHTRNVNTSFRELVGRFHREIGEWKDEHGELPSLETSCQIVKRPSRNGDVLMVDEPVTITYSHPRERVLLNAARDANPFFHLYHSLWMLAGRNDVSPLAYYVKNMINYSDDGETLNGAYGYRWRYAFRSSEGGGFNDTDQLKIIINHLKSDPTSRRAVLAMWNVEYDLLKIGIKCKTCKGDRQTWPTCSYCDSTGVENQSKDVCCNLNVMFSIRPSECYDDANGSHLGSPCYLDMTVTNRSNDMIWGMLGEDYCTFTFLQEYVAAHLGVEIGRYHHFTNNLHVYLGNWRPDEWLSQDDPLELSTVPLVKDTAAFDKELIDFVQLNGDGTKTVIRPRDWSEPFLATVAQPMMNVIHARKRREPPDRWVGEIEASDWRLAAETWLRSPNRGKRS